MTNENVKEVVYENQKLEIKAAIDHGNSEHASIINGQLIKQPNIFTRTRKIPEFEGYETNFLVNNIHENVVGTIVSKCIMGGSGTYYNGKHTSKAGKVATSTDISNTEKVNSEAVYVNTLLTIAAESFKILYNKDLVKRIDQSFDIIIDMATALPITQYSNSKAKEFAEKFMTNTHNVTLHLNKYNCNMNLKFEYVKVIPEGVTAVHALTNIDGIASIKKDDLSNIEMNKYSFEINIENSKEDIIEDESTDDNGNSKLVLLKKEYFKNKTIQHASIGEGTSEFPKTEDDKYDPNFMAGSNNGVGHAINNSLESFKEKIKIRTLTRQALSEIIIDKNHKFNTLAHDELYEHLVPEAEEIYRKCISELERSNNDVDCLITYGGGSILMKEFIEERLVRHSKSINCQYIYVNEKIATDIEVIGLNEFLKSNIFLSLKNKKMQKLEKQLLELKNNRVGVES